jgi:hypothetical protein
LSYRLGKSLKRWIEAPSDKERGQMPIEQAKVGQVAARLMERLEHDYETDESAEVSSVILISAVRHEAGELLTVHYDTSSGAALHEGMVLLQYVHDLISPRTMSTLSNSGGRIHRSS